MTKPVIRIRKETVFYRGSPRPFQTIFVVTGPRCPEFPFTSSSGSATLMRRLAKRWAAAVDGQVVGP